MKNRYSLLIFMISSLFVYAQQANNNFEAETVNLFTSPSSTNILPSHFNSSSATPIWSEDFSGGFPALWSTSSSNMAGAFATCPWAWTTDGTWGYYNGNQGTAGSNALTSTTASNGFLICDTDSANHYANGQPSGSTYQYIESLVTTNAIDLSTCAVAKAAARPRQ